MIEKADCGKMCEQKREREGGIITEEPKISQMNLIRLLSVTNLQVLMRKINKFLPKTMGQNGLTVTQTER